MKAKVIIEDSKTKIILIPENEFETDIIEKVENKSKDYDLQVEFKGDFNYSNTKQNFRIEIDLNKLK